MSTGRNYFIILFSIILFLVATTPCLLAKYILAPTGSLKIIGPVVGFFLAFGIYYKWKHIEKIFYFVFGLTIIGDFFILTKSTEELLLFILFLTLFHIGLLLIFIFSQKIKEHLHLKIKF